MSHQIPMATAPVAAPRNGLGIAALVIGLVSLSLSWIPFINYLSMILGVVGIALAIVGGIQVARRTATNLVVIIIGGALSALSMIAALAAFASFMNSI